LVFFEKIIKFFVELFSGDNTNNVGSMQQNQQGEIKLDRNKEYQIVGINKDFHSTAVEIDNVNKVVVGYDPNGNFKQESFYNLLSPEDLAYLKSNGYQFVNANSENKNKGTFTGMCGVLTTDWIEQELKTKLDERKQGVTKYNSPQQIYEHYAKVNQKNNPDVNRMMAKNRVHFLMSKGENIETLKEYSDKKTINISNIQSTNSNNVSFQTKSAGNSKGGRIMIGDVKNTDTSCSISSGSTKTNKQQQTSVNI